MSCNYLFLNVRIRLQLLLDVRGLRLKQMQDNKAEHSAPPSNCASLLKMIRNCQGFYERIFIH